MLKNHELTIAIDGPAAAGKSTVAKLIADQLSYIYIDTGAMYRALTLKALRKKIDVHDEKALRELLNRTTIHLQKKNGEQIVLLDDEDVTDAIRSHEVTANVSYVAAHSEVRTEMVDRQRQLASKTGVVMDGRDIGTHVLPNADVKFFLVASVYERAKRRHEENKQKGIPSDLQELQKEIEKRDKLDSSREVSPLMKAEDAIEIDTTSLTIDEVAEKLLQKIREAKRKGRA